MLAPGSEIGRYVVRRKLAEGGMAEIYLASALGPEGFAKDVVIKVVRPFLATDPQFVRMFIDEARLASRLNHANVVQIFDFGKHGDTWYLAMEYVRGASLWELRRRCREQAVPFPPTLAAEIVAQVARGLHYAHALSDGGQRLGVVHRDVTPHNVLLSFDGAVKLTDFGIAKAQLGQTQPGALKGKFAYMSPEQARGEPVDARTDLFALGIVLWELVTGGRLFDGDSDVAVLRAVQDSVVPPPSRLNPEVPPELSELILKALARPREERFQTAAELEKALGTFVLRSARSVEDTSVAAFLQHLFADELAEVEPPAAGPAPSRTEQDALLDGDTWASPKVAEAEASMTVTPLVPGPRRVTPTVPMRARDAGPRPAQEVPASLRKTDEDHGLAGDAPRPKTEQMPALQAPASRRFDPLPASTEPSVVLSRSMRSLPEATTPDSGGALTERLAADPALAGPLPARSRGPLLFALGGAVLLLAGAVFLPGLGPEAGAVTEGVQPPPDRAAEPTTPPLDAAPPREAEAPSPATPSAAAPLAEPAVEPAPEPAAPAPPAEVAKKSAVTASRRLGTLAVRASPYATVTIKGRQYEVTGVKHLPAPAGTYEVTLAHPRKTITQRVSVSAGETTAVSFSVD